MYTCTYKRNTILNKNENLRLYTVTVLEKRTSSYHKEVQRIAYTQRTGKVFFRTRRGSNYELVVFMGCKLLPIPLSDIRH